MKPEAVAIAESRLRSASRAYADLVEAQQDDEAFADIWFQFLSAWKSIWTTLEQGAKKADVSASWFEDKKSERATDMALSYMYTARNDEEHGLASTVRASNSLGHKFKLNRDATSMQVRYGQDGTCSLVDQDGNVCADLLAVRQPGLQLQAARVRIRGRWIIVEPPHEHRGQLIDIAPLSVALAVLTYADEMVNEARRLIAGTGSQG
ncbi:hypothetical protein [Sphingomonas sp. CFBP 8764]|uniref:hypothetical protein n=1 Tax=Sphingomonas sp. CFBP 8764 TaxID=2775275 RepID=UPI0017816DBD|nr:hypothetical protein [Sphingomonas sp. CFBP 8764]MBD8549503.1 hypothetical protein [Sphingomonas sp. CFBP 8764]